MAIFLSTSTGGAMCHLGITRVPSFEISLGYLPDSTVSRMTCATCPGVTVISSLMPNLSPGVPVVQIRVATILGRIDGQDLYLVGGKVILQLP